MSLFLRKSKQAARKASFLASLFVELERPLLAHAYRITGNTAVAQDIVQDAFLQLHHHAASVESPKAWLFRSVHNLAINASKRRSRETSLQTLANATSTGESDSASRTLGAFAEQASQSEPLPDDFLEQKELGQLAWMLIEQLDKRSQTVVRLKFAEDLSYKEIAERLHLSISNVGYILHQAVRSLADEFKRLERQ